MLIKFLRAESGAVTVDWTVVTAAVVGLGLTGTAAVRTGVTSLGSDINGSLSGASVASLGRLGGIGASVLASLGFESGNTNGWSYDRLTEIGDFGNVMGPFSGAETRSNPLTHTVEFPPGTATGTVEFDLLVLDSWDGSNNRWTSAEGDGITLQINGQTVTVENFMFQGHPASSSFPDRTADRTATVQIGGTTYDVTMTQSYEGHLSGTSGWPDQVWRVSVTADDPPPTMQVALSAGSNQGTSDESFAIDNYTVATR